MFGKGYSPVILAVFDLAGPEAALLFGKVKEMYFSDHKILSLIH